LCRHRRLGSAAVQKRDRERKPILAIVVAPVAKGNDKGSSIHVGCTVYAINRFGVVFRTLDVQRLLIQQNGNYHQEYDGRNRKESASFRAYTNTTCGTGKERVNKY
jgi:hypothetical protein